MRRRIVLGAAGVALLGAGGGAYAATRPSDDREAFLADAAKRLNVTPRQLSDALEGAAADRLDAAVKAGRLTQEQADRLKQRLRAGDGFPFPGGGDRGFGPHLGFGPGLHGVLDDAAKSLGLTATQLRDRLAGGDSLADVAKAEGKDVAALRRTLEQAVRTRVQDAVKDGRLTQAQADRRLDDLADEIAEAVRRPGLVGRGFGGHGPGPLGPGGPRGGRPFGLLDGAADYLGLTEAQLRDRLENGRSLAEIAKAQGKTQAGLENALVEDAKTRLDAAVAAGRLSRDEANRNLGALRAWVAELVERTELPGRWQTP